MSALTKAWMISCFTEDNMPANSCVCVEIIFGHKLAYPAIGLRNKDKNVPYHVGILSHVTLRRKSHIALTKAQI